MDRIRQRGFLIFFLIFLKQLTLVCFSLMLVASVAPVIANRCGVVTLRREWSKVQWTFSTKWKWRRETHALPTAGVFHTTTEVRHALSSRLPFVYATCSLLYHSAALCHLQPTVSRRSLILPRLETCMATPAYLRPPRKAPC